MIKQFLVLIFGGCSIAGAIGTANAADTCFPITGRVETQSLAGQIHQVGVARLNIGGSAFIGGISGTITGSGVTGQTILDHNLGFPGNGTIVTNGDIATITGQIDACRLGVSETIMYKSGTGVFANAMSMTATATGSINFCTGENRFRVVGQICYAEGSAPLAITSPKNDN